MSALDQKRTSPTAPSKDRYFIQKQTLQGRSPQERPIAFNRRLMCPTPVHAHLGRGAGAYKELADKKRFVSFPWSSSCTLAAELEQVFQQVVFRRLGGRLRGGLGAGLRRRGFRRRLG